LLASLGFTASSLSAGVVDLGAGFASTGFSSCLDCSGETGASACFGGGVPDAKASCFNI